MKKTCRVCSVEFEPDASRIRNREWICLKCRSIKSGIANRKAADKREQNGEPRWKTYKKPEGYWKKQKQDPVKRRAREKLKYALQTGKVVKGVCVECGGEAEAHHEDYNKPLDVIWLCRKHHLKRHRKH